MDWSFLDKTETTPPAEVAESTEMRDLELIAKYIPALHWQYDPSKIDGQDEKEHLGFVTQSLKKIPGLAGAVYTDENGVETFNGPLVASAALSLVAALARHVLNIKLEEDYANEPAEENNGK